MRQLLSALRKEEEMETIRVSTLTPEETKQWQELQKLIDSVEARQRRLDRDINRVNSIKSNIFKSLVAGTGMGEGDFDHCKIEEIGPDMFALYIQRIKQKPRQEDPHAEGTEDPPVM